MRKAGPILILVIGIAALIVNFVPDIRLPDSSSPDGQRSLETRLGLDLKGGLRVEYQAKQVGETGNPPATISQMSNPAVTSLIPEFEQFVAAAEKLTPVEVTWGPEFFEGVSIAGADVYAGKKTPQEAADWLQNTKFKDRKPLE